MWPSPSPPLQGVYGMRMLDLVMAFVLTAGVESMSAHLRKLCDQYDISLDTIKLSLKGSILAAFNERRHNTAGAVQN